MSRSHTLGTGVRGALPFSITLLLAPLVVAMALDLLPDFIPWVIPWIILPLVPYIKIVETFCKNDVPNLDRDTPESQVFWHMAILVAWAVVYPLLVIIVLWAVCNIPTLLLYERLVLLVFCGMLGRLVTITSHDLIHRPKLWMRRLAEFTMGTVAMPHMYTEHVYMHHPNVATPRDRESARIGQSYYNYFFTGLPYIYVEAIRVQQRRLARRGLSFWHKSNPFWLWSAMWIAWPALALVIGGWYGLAGWAFIALFAAWGIRAVDYMQHYGLQRILKPNGRYEPIQPHHSWNHSSASNYLYFSIQRHSDHHDRPTRPYPLLHSLPEDKAPSLPSHYGSMMTLLLFPSAWFRKMNPLVEEWRRKFYPEIKDWRALSSPAYHHRPESLPLISEIIQDAPFLARHMEVCYPLIDSITGRQFQQITIPDSIGMEPDELLYAQRGLLGLYYGREFTRREMIEDMDLSQTDMADEVAENAQVWSNGQAFQIGVRMMRGHVLGKDAGGPLSNMADAAITQLARAVLDEFVAYRGPVPGDGVAFVALGRLGERRMTFDSDVEMIALADGTPKTEENRFVLEDNAAEFCRRFNKVAAEWSANNMLARSVHLRAPASGIDNTTGALERFANGTGKPDAHFLQEVASARIVSVFGDRPDGLAERFEEARRSILLRHAPSIGDVLRQPAARRKGGGGEPLPAILEGPGGPGDLERIALGLRLLHGENHTEIAGSEGPVEVLKKAGECGILDRQTAEGLASAGSFLLGLECALSLVEGEGAGAAQWEDSVQATVARACDAEDFEDVVAKAKEAAARIAAYRAAASGPGAGQSG